MLVKEGCPKALPQTIEELIMNTSHSTNTPMPTASRRRRIGALMLGASLLALGLGATGGALIGPLDTPALAATSAPLGYAPDFTGLVERVKPAVVSVRVQLDAGSGEVAMNDNSGDGQDPFGGENPFAGTPFEKFFKEYKKMPRQGGKQPHGFAQALGSGFFISADGYAVTNNHVVDHAVKAEVVTDDGKTYPAKVIGTDPKTDLALIKVEGRSDFPFVELAAEKPRIGEWVLAVGNPFGLGGTVTAGIVSAEGRDIGSGPYDDFIQIDAPVNKGNSGGPTFNMQGQVVGVNTAIFSPSGGSVGIAFDIPATTVSSVIPSLKASGRVERAWLGVQIQPVTQDIADSLGLPQAKGALVSSPQSDSPAAKAGLQSGDVIAKVDGTEIQDARDLARTIGGMTPNSKVSLTIYRDGAEKSVALTLGRLQDDKAQAQAEPASAGSGDQMEGLGLTVEPAANVEGAGGDGLVVVAVDPSGKAAELGIAQGDVILKIGQEPVKSASDLKKLLGDAQAHGKKSALALIKRQEDQHFIALPTNAG